MQSAEFMLAIADTPTDSEVEVDLIRNKQPQTVKVLVGRRTLEKGRSLSVPRR